MPSFHRLAPPVKRRHCVRWRCTDHSRLAATLAPPALLFRRRCHYAATSRRRSSSRHPCLTRPHRGRPRHDCPRLAALGSRAATRGRGPPTSPLRPSFSAAAAATCRRRRRNRHPFLTRPPSSRPPSTCSSRLRLACRNFAAEAPLDTTPHSHHTATLAAPSPPTSTSLRLPRHSRCAAAFVEPGLLLLNFAPLALIRGRVRLSPPLMTTHRHHHLKYRKAHNTFTTDVLAAPLPTIVATLATPQVSKTFQKYFSNVKSASMRNEHR